MEAKELRIGNLVKILGEEVQVSRIIIGEHSGLNIVNGKPMNLVKPIPLTEEWFIKFGAKYSEYDFGYKIEGFPFTIDKRDFSLSITVAAGWENVISELDLKLEYVHQLQNLFYDFKRSELTIKQPEISN